MSAFGLGKVGLFFFQESLQHATKTVTLVQTEKVVPSLSFISYKGYNWI